MGRQEVPLDADAGEVQQFAAALRELRVQAGQPTYRKLAKSGHYSAATLARAASGRSLPSLEVALAYVAACGGDTDVWRRRWAETRRLHAKALTRAQRLEADASPASQDPAMGESARDAESQAVPEAVSVAEPGVVTGPGAVPGPASEDDAVAERPPTSDRATRRRWTKRALALRVLIVASLLANVVLASVLYARSHAAVHIEDGTDPKASHCDDARNLDVQPVILHEDTRIDGRPFAAGATIGTVSLRFSARCAAAWTRFDPAGTLFTNPSQGTVTVQASRLAEGAQATWRLGHIDQTYSDLLLTGMGCVQARVVVNIFDGDAMADGQTRCLPKM